MTVNKNSKKGTALLITGAAARITQEIALIEELYNRGILANIEFISGVSSGAINAIALNGIIENKISWDEYKALFLNLKNSAVYAHGKNKLPLDTSPLRNLLEEFIETKLGYTTIASLPITTAISITHHNSFFLKNKIFRMCNLKINEESDPQLRLVDIVMATTALPIVFPAVKIQEANTIPDFKYYDGGIGEDFIPYQALFQYEQFTNHLVDSIYIVSGKKGAEKPAISEELRALGINDHKLFDELGFSIDKLFEKEFKKELNHIKIKHPERLRNIFVWTPKFKESFPLINFENLEQQYYLSSAWAKKNNPKVLSEIK